MRETDFLRIRPVANLVRFALPALANATMVGFVANSLSLGLAVGATVLVVAGTAWSSTAASPSFLAWPRLPPSNRLS